MSVQHPECFVLRRLATANNDISSSPITDIRDNAADRRNPRTLGLPLLIFSEIVPHYKPYNPLNLMVWALTYHSGDFHRIHPRHVTF